MNLLLLSPQWRSNNLLFGDIAEFGIVLVKLSRSPQMESGVANLNCLEMKERSTVRQQHLCGPVPFGEVSQENGQLNPQIRQIESRRRGA